MKARRAILIALEQVPGMSSARLFEEVVSASCNRRRVQDARERLLAEGCITGTWNAWTLTAEGRAELARRAAA